MLQLLSPSRISSFNSQIRPLVISASARPSPSGSLEPKAFCSSVQAKLLAVAGVFVTIASFLFCFRLRCASVSLDMPSKFVLPFLEMPKCLISRRAVASESLETIFFFGRNSLRFPSCDHAQHFYMRLLPISGGEPSFCGFLASFAPFAKALDQKL